MFKSVLLLSIVVSTYLLFSFAGKEPADQIQSVPEYNSLVKKTLWDADYASMVGQDSVVLSFAADPAPSSCTDICLKKAILDIEFSVSGEDEKYELGKSTLDSAMLIVRTAVKGAYPYFVLSVDTLHLEISSNEFAEKS